jgi:glycosyltransferase involved in cell wall biosynthesis
MKDSGLRRVTLCILTYCRPRMLGRLLASVALIAVPTAWNLDVVVIDNDPARSGEPVVAEASAHLAVPLRYVVEERRGIPQARNRAVAEAGDAQWLVFLDDDQVPMADWLEQLDRTQRETGADVALGPVFAEYEEEPRTWVRDGRFLESDRFASGTEVPYWNARTSGVLIRMDRLRTLGARPFDERLALTGGEDHKLFDDLQHAGAAIVWADDAHVRDIVPPSRTTLRWLLQRSYRIGVTRSMLLRFDRVGLPRLAKRIGAGGRLMTIAAVSAARGPDRTTRIRALCWGATGLGLMAGVFGARYEEYQVIHGD